MPKIDETSKKRSQRLSLLLETGKIDPATIEDDYDHHNESKEELLQAKEHSFEKLTDEEVNLIIIVYAVLRMCPLVAHAHIPLLLQQV